MNSKKRLVIAMLVFYSGWSCAGLGEKNWRFEVDEVDLRDLTNSSIGVEYGCEFFTPKLVTFKINYTNPDVEPVIKIGNTGTVIKTAKLEYVIDGVDRLTLTYKKGGAYNLKNETGEVVVGQNCDAGVTG
ncbi:hypothetical protein EKN38_25275 [Enterobacter sp. WCHEn045836]|uniref:hypothetical protein n=1 Tax=Enterobacter sp. WCHEn045836 TaxID=2497434 RepID=UPI000F846377|nr:hypothetical protein [Enterobacter sp. WCHEn045836]RTP93711.1 hypothetical protein EKN38_25275 [Enterobacter sp. WCHEn045836]